MKLDSARKWHGRLSHLHPADADVVITVIGQECNFSQSILFYTPYKEFNMSGENV